MPFKKVKWINLAAKRKRKTVALRFEKHIT